MAMETAADKAWAQVMLSRYNPGEARMDECLQFSLGHSCIDSFTIGIEQAEQFTDLQKRIPAASIRG